MTSMMKVFSFSLVLMLGLGLPVEHAEAKRFGGGFSFGKSFSTPKKAPAAAPKQQAPASSPTAPAKGAAAGAKPGMGGMMGGLLAGGLLGALFFGGAFDGIQMMDILLIALVGFVLYSLFARKPQARQPNYASAGNERYREEPEQPAYQPQAFEQQGSILGGGLSEAEVELPSWFNKEAFLQGATQHFETLQKAWGENDLGLIEEYCQSDFYQMLVAERAKLPDTSIELEVVSVMAEILGFNEINGEAQLSVHFYGWMKEGAGEETTEFSEIWHLTRDTLEPNADWFLVGIEQP